MTVSYWLDGLLFEWDDRKARDNLDKHGVRFEEAAETFLDPFGREAADASIHDEDRIALIGNTLENRMLLVVHVERAAVTRIISARPATRAERKLYERAR